MSADPGSFGEPIRETSLEPPLGVAQLAIEIAIDVEDREDRTTLQLSRPYFPRYSPRPIRRYTSPAEVALARISSAFPRSGPHDLNQRSESPDSAISTKP